MEYSTLINDYIDGRLDKDNENELFKALYSNDELRSEFRRMMLIESAMLKDSSSLAPSIHSIETTFARLGFSAVVAPADQPKPAAAVNKPVRFGFFKGRFGSHLFSSLLTSGLTALLMYVVFFMAGNAPPDVPASPSGIGMIGTHEYYTANPGNNGTINNNSIKLNPYHNNNNVPVSPADVSVLDNTDKLFIPLTTVNSDPTVNTGPALLNGKTVFCPVYHFISIDKPTSVNPVMDESDISAKRDMDSRMTIQLNNSVKSFFLPAAKISESSATISDNIGVNVLYNINNDIALGLDLRKEYFYQEYTGTEDGNKYTYLQFPSLISLGLAGRYYYFDMNKFSSFAELQMGLNRAGILGRLSVGLSYAPNPAYSFIIAIEGSGLMYNHDNWNFFSSRLGLHYGVALNF